MPGWTFDGLWVGAALASFGNVIIATHYWWNLEYKLSTIFICYAVATLIFMTITGTK